MEQAFRKIDLFIPSSTINANQGSKTKILLKNTTIIRWNKVEQNGTKLKEMHMDDRK